MRKFVVLLFSLLIQVYSYALNESDVSIEFLKYSEDSNSALFEIRLPNGWHMAKSPDISSETDSEKFKYDGKFQEVGDGKFQLSCKLNNGKRNILHFDLFVCRDLCSIISKTVIVPPNVPSDSDYSRLLLMLLFGFIGGILLNVMPCVLPVILLKLRQIKTRQSILNSILGNYLCFAALAVILAFLKQSGEAVGWGMHFQNIYFLKFAAAFFFILILMSFGQFNLYFSFNSDFINNALFNGQTRQAIKDIVHSFMTTLVAIPCTAPFLGTAAAFAIQESLPSLFLIFAATSTGFSVPYFLCLFLRISDQRWLRSPLFNKIINFGVSAVFLWILWLLCNRVSLTELLIISAIFLVAFILIIKQYQKTALIALFTVVVIDFSAPKTVSHSFEKKTAEIATAVADNEVVMLNISADWCLSCQYNKLKFKNPVVAEAMKRVKLIEVDITEPDSAVMAFIREHGRAGIPFTIVYGPKQKQGLLLSEIPSADEIIKAIDLVK